jgi:hypothetical protein
VTGYLPVKQSPSDKPKTFADYKADAKNWITLATGEYYPDILKDACELYKPVLVLFGQLLQSSESSTRLFLQIAEQSNGWMRVQLARVFRRYLCPSLPVEMFRRKRKASRICKDFDKEFRPIHQVQEAFTSRPIPDEALCALLWEYKNRGKEGYDFTERLFDLFHATFPDLSIKGPKGPKRAGKDVPLGKVFENYPRPNRPVDFVILDKSQEEILAIGLARYDSNRGGAQEDDRTGGYHNCADEILNYAKKRQLRTKVIFVNDGPGLLLGSMWDDYAALEGRRMGRILVVTLRMVPERITREWLLS